MPEPRWKKIARNLIFLLVIASALPLALAAYHDIQSHKAGEYRPTIEKPIETSSTESKDTFPPRNTSAFT